jgi:hypothetical protein
MMIFKLGRKKQARLTRQPFLAFPLCTMKDKIALLFNILQTLMWISSALHAAVNFPQYDFYAYASNKPLTMRALLPASNREDIFKNALTTVANA